MSGFLKNPGGPLDGYTGTLVPDGTTQTLDFGAFDSFVIDLEGASGDVTLTIDNARLGLSYIIKVIQGSTPRDLVYPASVLWDDGVLPVISTADDAEDTIGLWFDGTNFYALIAQNYS